MALQLKYNPSPSSSAVEKPTKPNLKIFKVEGEQRTDTSYKIINDTVLPFYITHNLVEEPKNCITDVESCTTLITFEDYGDTIIANLFLDIETDLGGTYGFSVHFYNGLSNISQGLQNISLLDPAPSGTGEWTPVEVPKWKYNWVESYVPLEGPVTFELKYQLMGFPGSTYDIEIYESVFYLPANGIPSFTLEFYKGTARRIQYTLNNTDPEGYQPPPCIIDWPTGTFQGVTKWTIDHCNNVVSKGMLIFYLIPIMYNFII